MSRPPVQHQEPQPQPGDRRATSLRQAAARIVRSSSPPTVPIAVQASGDQLDDARARSVVDLALRVGEALLSTGAGASEVTADVLRLADAYGVRSCYVDVSFTSVAMSYHRGQDDDPLTAMRVVRIRTLDYTRLEDVQRLVREIAEGQLDLAAARTRLEEVVRAPHPYRRWLVTGALAGLAAAVAALLGAGFWIIALTAVTSAVIDRVQRQLSRSGLPAFFTQAAGAAIPTSVAVVLFMLLSYGPVKVSQFSPSLVVASGIVVLLASLGLVGSAQDAIDGYYVTALSRGFEVFVLTLGIVVGVGVVLAVAHRAGVPMQLSQQATLSPHLSVQGVSATAVAGFFALSAYTRVRGVVLAALIAGVGWVMFQTSAVLGAGPSTASALAAAVVGLLAQVVAARFRVPALAVTTAGIVPLLPGLTLYRGLYQLVQLSATEGYTPAFTSLFAAAGIGTGLAIGVSFGTFVGRHLRFELDRWEQRALRRSTSGARD